MSDPNNHQKLYPFLADEEKRKSFNDYLSPYILNLIKKNQPSPIKNLIKFVSSNDIDEVLTVLNKHIMKCSILIKSSPTDVFSKYLEEILLASFEKEKLQKYRDFLFFFAKTLVISLSYSY